jgi:hypothetical protein
MDITYLSEYCTLRYPAVKYATAPRYNDVSQGIYSRLFEVQDVTSQRTGIFGNTTVRTSNNAARYGLKVRT